MFEINFEEIRKSGLFDYTCNHYWEMSKEQLASIIKEFNYAVYSIDKGLEKKCTEIMIEELKEMCGE